MMRRDYEIFLHAQDMSGLIRVCVSIFLSISHPRPLDRVGCVDNTCDGREGYSDELFFMYFVLFISLHVRLPFDEFTVKVLHILNVAPSQLHLNA